MSDQKRNQKVKAGTTEVKLEPGIAGMDSPPLTHPQGEHTRKRTGVSPSSASYGLDCPGHLPEDDASFGKRSDAQINTLTNAVNSIAGKILDRVIADIHARGRMEGRDSDASAISGNKYSASRNRQSVKDNEARSRSDNRDATDRMVDRESNTRFGSGNRDRDANGRSDRDSDSRDVMGDRESNIRFRNHNRHIDATGRRSDRDSDSRDRMGDGDSGARGRMVDRDSDVKGGSADRHSDVRGRRGARDSDSRDRWVDSKSDVRGRSADRHNDVRGSSADRHSYIRGRSGEGIDSDVRGRRSARDSDSRDRRVDSESDVKGRSADRHSDIRGKSGERVYSDARGRRGARDSDFRDRRIDSESGVRGRSGERVDRETRGRRGARDSDSRDRLVDSESDVRGRSADRHSDARGRMVDRDSDTRDRSGEKIDSDASGRRGSKDNDSRDRRVDSESDVRGRSADRHSDVRGGSGDRHSDVRGRSGERIDSDVRGRRRVRDSDPRGRRIDSESDIRGRSADKHTDVRVDSDARGRRGARNSDSRDGWVDSESDVRGRSGDGHSDVRGRSGERIDSDVRGRRGTRDSDSRDRRVDSESDVRGRSADRHNDVRGGSGDRHSHVRGRSGERIDSDVRGRRGARDSDSRDRWVDSEIDARGRSADRDSDVRGRSVDRDSDTRGRRETDARHKLEDNDNYVKSLLQNLDLDAVDEHDRNIDANHTQDWRGEHRHRSEELYFMDEGGSRDTYDWHRMEEHRDRDSYIRSRSRERNIHRSRSRDRYIYGMRRSQDRDIDVRSRSQDRDIDVRIRSRDIRAMRKGRVKRRAERKALLAERWHHKNICDPDRDRGQRLQIERYAEPGHHFSQVSKHGSQMRSISPHDVPGHGYAYSPPLFSPTQRMRKPCLGETRIKDFVKMHATEAIGFQIEQFYEGGIVVSYVAENSLAANNGIFVGDQILEFCGIALQDATKESATNVMVSCQELLKMKMVVQFNPDKRRSVPDESMDSQDADRNKPEFQPPVRTSEYSQPPVQPTDDQSLDELMKLAEMRALDASHDDKYWVEKMANVISHQPTKFEYLLTEQQTDTSSFSFLLPWDKYYAFYEFVLAKHRSTVELFDMAHELQSIKSVSPDDERLWIDKMAWVISKHPPEFENKFTENQINNPAFSFLFHKDRNFVFYTSVMKKHRAVEELLGLVQVLQTLKADSSKDRNRKILARSSWKCTNLECVGINDPEQMSCKVCSLPKDSSAEKLMIDKIASVISRHPAEFESTFTKSQIGNPAFSFLFHGDENYDFYKTVLTKHRVAMEPIVTQVLEDRKSNSPHDGHHSKLKRKLDSSDPHQSAHTQPKYSHRVKRISAASSLSPKIVTTDLLQSTDLDYYLSRSKPVRDRPAHDRPVHDRPATDSDPWRCVCGNLNEGEVLQCLRCDELKKWVRETTTRVKKDITTTQSDRFDRPPDTGNQGLPHNSSTICTAIREAVRPSSVDGFLPPAAEAFQPALHKPFKPMPPEALSPPQPEALWPLPPVAVTPPPPLVSRPPPTVALQAAPTVALQAAPTVAFGPPPTVAFGPPPSVALWTAPTVALGPPPTVAFWPPPSVAWRPPLVALRSPPPAVLRLPQPPPVALRQPPPEALRPPPPVALRPPPPAVLRPPPPAVALRQPPPEALRPPPPVALRPPPPAVLRPPPPPPPVALRQPSPEALRPPPPVALRPPPPAVLRPPPPPVALRQPPPEASRPPPPVALRPPPPVTLRPPTPNALRPPPPEAFRPPPPNAFRPPQPDVFRPPSRVLPDPWDPHFSADKPVQGQTFQDKPDADINPWKCVCGNLNECVRLSCLSCDRKRQIQKPVTPAKKMRKKISSEQSASYVGTGIASAVCPDPEKWNRPSMLKHQEKMSQPKPHPGETRIINITKNYKTEDVGFKIELTGRGGIFVSAVVDNGLAANNGIVVGDQILEFCGIQFRNPNDMRSASIMKMLSNRLELQMVLKLNPDSIARAVCPDPERRNKPSMLKHQKKMSRPNPRPGKTRIINIKKSYKTEDVGFKIELGKQGGIFVSALVHDGLAATSGIVVGDQILEFCGIYLRDAHGKKSAAMMKSFSARRELEVVVQFNPDKIISPPSWSLKKSSPQSSAETSLPLIEMTAQKLMKEELRNAKAPGKAALRSILKKSTTLS